MKTIISYKGLRIEITIDDGRYDDELKFNGDKPPKKPADVAYPMSLNDTKTMDEQVEAAKKILEEEY